MVDDLQTAIRALIDEEHPYQYELQSGTWIRCYKNEYDGLLMLDRLTDAIVQLVKARRA